MKTTMELEDLTTEQLETKLENNEKEITAACEEILGLKLEATPCVIHTRISSCASLSRRR